MALCSSSNVPFTVPNCARGGQEEGVYGVARSDQARAPERGPVPASLLVRMAMRVSRAKWFTFLRRVFKYQNGTRTEVEDNPFNSAGWMMLELIVIVSQICITLLVLLISKSERPVWPMRFWIVGYDFGCLINLLILYWRHKHCQFREPQVGDVLLDLESHRRNEDSRKLHLVNKCRASLDLFFAMWFVMGIVWVFDSRFEPVIRAPKLHILCITILSWNAMTYSFPMLLFLLLCICVPLVSSFIGYNISLGSAEKGASDDQISKLHCWRYTQVQSSLLADNSSPSKEDHECCICLTKYKEKEEIRQLPCSHNFHKNCVDHWLKIISCCPLCKQSLDK